MPFDDGEGVFRVYEVSHLYHVEVAESYAFGDGILHVVPGPLLEFMESVDSECMFSVLRCVFDEADDGVAVLALVGWLGW